MPNLLTPAVSVHYVTAADQGGGTHLSYSKEKMKLKLTVLALLCL